MTIMKQFLSAFGGSLIGFSLATLLWFWIIEPCFAPAKVIAQKEQVEIVSVYQIQGGFYETCLRHKDGTISLWTNHNLGSAGDKIFIWRNGKDEWIQDPN